MNNYKLLIQYEGTKYNGWQRQGNTSNTIEQKFEDILFKMTSKPTEIYASGRTDAGVHAKCQVANFKCDTDMSPEEILTYINRYLPQDIAVTDIKIADERFHARLCAVSKTYEYLIAYRKKPDVFSRRTQYYINEIPDTDKMKKAAVLFLGTHDFKGFSSLGRTKKSTVRTINSIDITECDNVISIKINGSGFLYNMVRIISGTLLEIGLGKKDISSINTVFESNNREFAGMTLPPNGLTLINVYYK